MNRIRMPGKHRHIQCLYCDNTYRSNSMKRHVARMHSFGVTAVPKIREVPPAAPNNTTSSFDPMVFYQKQKQQEMEAQAAMAARDLLAIFGGA